MRIWLVNSAEMVPIDPGNARLQRMGILAEMLANKGHDVLWWTSTFRHGLKTQRFLRDTSVSVHEKYRLRFLYAPGYQRNISLTRLYNHYVLGRKFKAQAIKEQRPDVILCSLPTLELSAEAVTYGRMHQVPVVLDIRDMWPDIFLDFVPRWAAGPARIALTPLTRLARYACRGAYALLGHAPAFVEWGLELGRRKRTAYDRDFPFGYLVKKASESEMEDAYAFWRRLGVASGPGKQIICFFGLIGHMFDMPTVIDAARRLKNQSKAQFVLCGPGVKLEAFRQMAQDCPNVLFPGWVNAPQIAALMQLSTLALTPYVARYDFEASIPNKFIEYLSAGLPVLTSLDKGIHCDLLQNYHCGKSYRGNAQELAKIISLLQDAPAERKVMADNARTLFCERFDGNKVYAEMIQHLEEVASKAASERHRP